MTGGAERTLSSGDPARVQFTVETMPRGLRERYTRPSRRPIF